MIEVCTKPDELTEKVLSIRGSDIPRSIIADIGGGSLCFAQAIYPGVSFDDVYVQRNKRESEGKGPHFDVYQKYINQAYPWIGIFNLSGLVTLKTTELSQDLSKSYESRYPSPTRSAFIARRLFSTIAFISPDAQIDSENVNEGMGIVFQQRQARHTVHDIVPVDGSEPGEYLKLMVPNKDNSDSLKLMKSGGYIPISRIINAGISDRAEMKSFLDHQPNFDLSGTEEEGLLD